MEPGDGIVWEGLRGMAFLEEVSAVKFQKPTRFQLTVLFRVVDQMWVLSLWSSSMPACCHAPLQLFHGLILWKCKQAPS